MTVTNVQRPEFHIIIRQKSNATDQLNNGRCLDLLWKFLKQLKKSSNVCVRCRSPEVPKCVKICEILKIRSWSTKFKISLCDKKIIHNSIILRSQKPKIVFRQIYAIYDEGLHNVVSCGRHRHYFCALAKWNWILLFMASLVVGFV